MPSATTTHAHKDRLDWHATKGQVSIGAVAVALLGEPVRRNGSTWLYHCPMPGHADANPSFAMDVASGRWRCWSMCGGGDLPALVMALEGATFPEAVRRVAELGGAVSRPSPPRSAKRAERPEPKPSGLPREDAERIVAEAAEALWRPEGREALADLRRRGLSDATIRRARLGFVAGLAIPRRNGDGFFRASGVSIPWFDATGTLQRIKIRQADGRTPKYAEAFRGSPTLYAPFGIIPGRPLVLCEGELDALLLAQAIGDFASVATTGSADDRPTADVLAKLPTDAPWFIAHDADEAGGKAAGRWLCFPWATRLRPPAKDWCDAHALGRNVVRNLWLGVVRSAPRPSWEELQSQRWGPALEEPEADDDGDAEWLAERRAIAEADGIDPPDSVRPFGDWLAKLDRLRGSSMEVAEPEADPVDAAWRAELDRLVECGDLALVAEYRD